MTSSKGYGSHRELAVLDRELGPEGDGKTPDHLGAFGEPVDLAGVASDGGFAPTFPPPFVFAEAHTGSSGSGNGDISVALKFGLELLKRGAMLVHSDSTPYLANRVALEILRKKDGLSLSTSGIRAESARETQLLLSLLRRATAFPSEGEPSDSPMYVRRRSDPAFIVRVAPGPEVIGRSRTDGRTALVTISDPSALPEIREQDFIRLYGLTKGEAAIAALIIRGRSIEEAADTLFISAHTARTHLKRIFLKTETHRQPELVVRLLSTVL